MIAAFLIAVLVSAPMTGKASYYGNEFEGRKTASGEIFRQRLHTAAHRTLPFGTWLRVSRGDRSCLVRVNDRGPFVRGRIVDLSRSAAERIGLIGPGVATVSVEVIGAPDFDQLASSVRFIRGEIPADVSSIKAYHPTLPIGYKGSLLIAESSDAASDAWPPITQQELDTNCVMLSIDRIVAYEIVGSHAGSQEEIVFDRNSPLTFPVALKW